MCIWISLPLANDGSGLLGCPEYGYVQLQQEQFDTKTRPNVTMCAMKVSIDWIPVGFTLDREWLSAEQHTAALLFIYCDHK